MRFKSTILTSVLCSSALLGLVSCDDDDSSSGPTVPRIQFPSAFQSGDVITFTFPGSDATSTWNFNDAETFTWDGSSTVNTFSVFSSNRTAETFLIRDAGITRDAGIATLEERVNTLLADFDSPLRTITLERTQAGEAFTAEDLITFRDLINAEAAERGEIIVDFDPETEELLLVTKYDIDFEVTSGIGSFVAGEYTGSFTATHEGFIIRFRPPTGDERESFRLTADHRVPRVTSAERDLSELIEGDFTWTLSAIAPVEENAAAASTDTTDTAAATQ